MRTNRHIPLALALALIAAAPAPARAVPIAYLDLPGDVLVPTTGPESLRIVINVPARRLNLVAGERLVASYPVAGG